MTITELAIKRPTLVVVIFSFLGVLGIFGFMNLKYDLMPKMTIPVVLITTVYPGGSPNEVETSVTKIVEDAVTGIEGATAIRSTSLEGYSTVVIEFEQNVDINIALQDAERRVNQYTSSLPTTVKKPTISKISFDEIPVVRMAVRSSMDAKKFTQFVKDNVQPRISQLGGVGNVQILGSEEREIVVAIDFEKLKAYELSLYQVAQTIKASNVDFPTGNIKDLEDQYVVRVAGKFQSIEEMKALVVGKSKQGGEIKLSDIADVQDGIQELTNINRLNGNRSLGLIVQKQSDANTVDVSENVTKEIKKLEKDYADIGLTFEIAQDASEFIIESARSVEEDLVLAIILVAFVMFVFLHNLRNSLIVLVSIPTSLISTFFVMYIFDFTLNMMTLLAMSLVIGILVDDSIVVLENIYRHLEMGDNQRDAALRGRNEIGFAAMSITMVDVVVFVPLALITGVIGDFLRQYSLVVVFSTLMSLLVSFTVTPTLSSRFSKLQHLNPKTIFGAISIWLENLIQWVTNSYQRILKWALNHGWAIVSLSFVLFISSVMLSPLGFIGSEFMPNVDRGELVLTVELDPGVSLDKTNQVSLEVEKVLSKLNENGKPVIKKVMASVGASGTGQTNSFTNNIVEFTISFIDKNERRQTTDELGLEIKKGLSQMSGIKARVAPVGLMGSSNSTPIQLLVRGENRDEVLEASKTVLAIVKNIKGTSDVKLSTEEGKPELRVDIDRAKMAKFGISVSEVGQNLRIMLTGDDDAKYREGITEYDIRIQLDKFDRSKVENVANFNFVNTKGQTIQLKQFAEIYQTTGPTKLERYDRISSVMINSQAFGRTTGEIANEITETLKNTKLPAGIKWEFTGQQKYMADSFKSMFYAIFAAILFIYMIMVALYNSYLYPFVVLFSIPLAMIGAFYGLAITGRSISIWSILGIIMLIGLVAKNAILLVDRTNQMREEQNLSVREALLDAGQVRLRPILMTTFSMVMGMMPIAISKAAGGEAKSGLAIVLIGGLLSSLFLTLVLVPVIYQSFEKWKVGLKKLFKRQDVLIVKEVPDENI